MQLLTVACLAIVQSLTLTLASSLVLPNGYWVPSGHADKRPIQPTNADLIRFYNYLHQMKLVDNEVEFQKPVQARACGNLMDEGCSSGQLPGSGGDSDFLGGGGTPGKRAIGCVNLFDEGCSSGYLPGTGGDSDFLGGGGTPGKRSIDCVYVWDEGCSNGQIPGAGSDSDFLGGGGTPGKRSLVDRARNFLKNHRGT